MRGNPELPEPLLMHHGRDGGIEEGHTYQYWPLTPTCAIRGDRKSNTHTLRINHRRGGVVDTASSAVFIPSVHT